MTDKLEVRMVIDGHDRRDVISITGLRPAVVAASLNKIENLGKYASSDKVMCIETAVASALTPHLLEALDAEGAQTFFPLHKINSEMV